MELLKELPIITADTLIAKGKAANRAEAHEAMMQCYMIDDVAALQPFEFVFMVLSEHGLVLKRESELTAEDVTGGGKKDAMSSLSVFAIKKKFVKRPDVKEKEMPAAPEHDERHYAEVCMNVAQE